VTKIITLALPDDVAKAAELAAAANGETLEAYFARLASYDAERQTTEAYFAERRSRADLGAARDLLAKPRGETPGQ
jgi:hypothetical protein